MGRAPKIMVLILVLAFLAGGITYGLDRFGVISISKKLSSVPLLGKAFPDNKKTKKTGSVSPEELEQLRLKKKVRELNEKVKNLSDENQTLENRNAEMEIELERNQKETEENLKNEKSAEELAKYYAEMKPANAVKIMEKLDDDLVIDILSKLEESQAAKILSVMDPDRAAALTQKMYQ